MGIGAAVGARVVGLPAGERVVVIPVGARVVGLLVGARAVVMPVGASVALITVGARVVGLIVGAGINIEGLIVISGGGGGALSATGAAVSARVVAGSMVGRFEIRVVGCTVVGDGDGLGSNLLSTKFRFFMFLPRCNIISAVLSVRFPLESQTSTKPGRLLCTILYCPWTTPVNK